MLFRSRLERAIAGSRIRIKSDWWQFEDGERLKTEEGWTRFDQRAYNVTNNLFEPARDFTYGPIDLPVAAKIAPALDILGSVCQLLEASDGVVRIKCRSRVETTEDEAFRR